MRQIYLHRVAVFFMVIVLAVTMIPAAIPNKVQAAKSTMAKAEIENNLVIPRYITEDLQSDINGIEIIWQCDKPEIIAANGRVTHPKNGNVTVNITAKAGDVTVSAKAEVMEYGGSVLTYVIQGGTYPLAHEEGNDLLAYQDSRRSDSLHVAAMNQASGVYEELNKGKAILYVKWNGDQKLAQNANWQMGSPGFFRDADRNLCVAASANNKETGIYVWDAGANMTFTNERYITLNTQGIAVADPVIYYDASSGKYKVFWVGGDRKSYLTILDDLNANAAGTQTVTGYANRKAVTAEIPAKAVREEAMTFTMSKDEYDLFLKKYGTVYNNGMNNINLSVKRGASLEMPETITANYSDGSAKNLGVKWNDADLNAVNTSERGVYRVKGEVQQSAYSYPFIPERADPHLFYNEDDGYYYSTGSHYPDTNPTVDDSNIARCYRKITLRRAKTVAELRNAPEHFVLESDIGDRWGGFFWAPEFHKINGTWYCLVGAHDYGAAGIQSDSDFGWCSKSILIPYVGNGNPLTSIEDDMKAGGMLDKNQWGEPIILDEVWPYDVNYYYDDVSGQGYYVWVGNRIGKVKGSGAPLLDGPSSVIRDLTYPWEYGILSGSFSPSNPEGTDQGVIEGQYLFEHGDKVYMTYSGGTVDQYYCLGVMMADKGSDLTDPANWTSMNYPALMAYDTLDGDIGGVPHAGGGHNSLALDEYGNPILIYHARPYPDPHAHLNGAGGLFDPCRHTAVKSVNIGFDGTMILNMTAEEELNPAYKNITATVGVGEFTVTFDSAGGSSVAPALVNAGGKMSRPENPKKDGYLFVGWFQSGSLTAFNFDKTTIQSDITLVAKWSKPAIPANVQAVINMIEAIKSVSGNSLPVIKAAEDAYNALSPEDKKLVTNYQKLKDARMAYHALTAIPAKGSKHNAGQYRYKVTKAAAGNKSGTVELLSPASSTMKTASIPGEVKINGYNHKVTAIAAKAFKNNKMLTSVTIKKSVAKIGKQSFAGCRKLKKITIKTVNLKKKSIGKDAIKGIHKKAIIKVPAKKLTSYRKLFKKSTGYRKTMKIK